MVVVLPYFTPTAEWVSATVAVLGAVLIPIEYLRQRQNQKMAEAGELERRYDEDASLRFAVLCLDWGEGQLPVPNEYVQFIGAPAIKHDRTTIYKALRPELLDDVSRDQLATLYRQSFVALFNHIEQIMRLWDRGRVRKNDLPKTLWISRQLVKWSYCGTKYRSDEWFIPALKSWYPDVNGGRSLDHFIIKFAE